MTWVTEEWAEYEYRVLHEGEQIYRGLNGEEAMDVWRKTPKSVLQRRRVGNWETAG